MSAVLNSTEQASNAPVFEVSLRADDALQSVLRQGGGLVAVAEACVIDSPDMALMAKSGLDNVVAFRRLLTEKKAGFVAPAKQIIANAEALFDGPAAEAVKAEQIYRQRLTAWNVEQQRLEAERRRAAEEEARKIRQKAEQEAAAARARAEEQAREQRRLAEEAEQRRLQAVTEGNARAAAAAAADAAKAAERAQAAIETGEVKAAETQLAAAAVLDAPRPASVGPVGGMRANWEPVLDTKVAIDENAAKVLVCKAIVEGRKDLLAMIEFDKAEMKKLAGVLKEQFNVPGFVAKNNPSFVNRGKKS